VNIIIIKEKKKICIYFEQATVPTLRIFIDAKDFKLFVHDTCYFRDYNLSQSECIQHAL